MFQFVWIGLEFLMTSLKYIALKVCRHSGSVVFLISQVEATMF